MRKTFLFIYGIFILVIPSCDKDSGPYIVKSNALQPTISFSKDIQSIFNNRCIKCHNETHQSLNLKPCCSWERLNDGYVDTMNPTNSIIYKRLMGILTPQMPKDGPPYLPQSDIDNILQWIKEGAKNN